MKLFGKKNKKLAKFLPLILILILVVAALIVVWATRIRQQTGGKAAYGCQIDANCPGTGPYIRAKCVNGLCQYYSIPTPTPSNIYQTTIAPKVTCGGVCGPKRCLMNQVCKTSILSGKKTYLCQNDSRCAGN